METIQTIEERQTQKDQISIEGYLEKLRQNRIEIIKSRDQFKMKLPLTFNQFCKLVQAHGSCYLANRGEITEFNIDRDNEQAIKQFFLYFNRDRAFKGDLQKGILLNGKYGSGKTALMWAIMNTFNDCVAHWVKERSVRDIFPIKMYKSSDIVDGFRFEANKSGRLDSSWLSNPKIDISKKNYQTGIIIIDELGREQKEITVWGTVIQPLTQVLQERYDKGYPTFATANFRLETLAQDEYYGKMIGDRLRQMFNEIELTGESRRK